MCVCRVTRSSYASQHRRFSSHILTLDGSTWVLGVVNSQHSTSTFQTFPDPRDSIALYSWPRPLTPCHLRPGSRPARWGLALSGQRMILATSRCELWCRPLAPTSCCLGHSRNKRISILKLSFNSHTHFSRNSSSEDLNSCRFCRCRVRLPRPPKSQELAESGCIFSKSLSQNTKV